MFACRRGGWNFETGDKVTLGLTPMIGGVVGKTDGIIPALEFTLAFWRVASHVTSREVFLRA